MKANITSAVLLMTVGDIMAQEIERSYRSEEELKSREPKLSFRRYGTLSPDVQLLQEEHDKRKKELDEKREDYDDSVEGTFLALDHFQDTLEYIRNNLVLEFASLDYFRTATMALWAGAGYGPFFVFLYRLFDRFLPGGSNFRAVAPRVGLALVVSIGVNTAFFIYGSYIHHFAEWLTLIKEWQYELKEMGAEKASFRSIIQEVPYDFEMARSTARLKLESELWRTTTTSASVWIPINTANFALCPPHLRPLTLMVCSTFWNAYLSIAQHRDATIER